MTVPQLKTDAVMPIMFLTCIMLVCFCFFAGMAEATAMDNKPDTVKGALKVPTIATKVRQRALVEVKRPNQVNRPDATSMVRESAYQQRLQEQFRPGSRFGDRMYIVQPYDQPELLALELTGSSSSWVDIARYNRLDVSAGLMAGQLIYIPQELIQQTPSAEQLATTFTQPQLLAAKLDNDPFATPASPASTTGFFEPTTVENLPDIVDLEPERGSDAQVLARVFDQQQDRLNSAVISKLAGQSDGGTTDNPLSAVSSDTATRNVDMFAGQARVFGKVAVDRVAVGNGAILRAEVLDNGELLAIAQTEGSSSLHLWHKDGSHSSFNVRVSATDPEIRVRLDKTIRMRVKMIEFRKSALERMGIDWGDSIEGPVFATVGDAVSNSLFRPNADGVLGDSATLPLAIKPFSSYFGIATQLSSRINLLVNRGDAEMLAEPVLSCGNGGTARFLAGGEVPYPTIGSNGQTTVDFREYGIRLEISPRVDEFNNIQAEIMTEVSSIDPSVSVMGAPGLLTRRTQTQVSSRAGNTIVIAGLMQLEKGSDTDSVPGLGRLPVLGKLFRSDSSNKSVSELVIFITPEVIEPGKPVLAEREEQTHQYVMKELQETRRKIRQYKDN